jgi:hypothetical protein
MDTKVGDAVCAAELRVGDRVRWASGLLEDLRGCVKAADANGVDDRLLVETNFLGAKVELAVDRRFLEQDDLHDQPSTPAAPRWVASQIVASAPACLDSSH